MKLSNILIGIALTVLVSTSFLLLLVNGVEKYNPTNIPTDYNKSFVRIQNNLAELSRITNDTDVSLNEQDSSSNVVTDFLGFFFGQGYKAAKVLVLGVNLNGVIINEATDNALTYTGMGETYKAVGLLLVFIFIILLLISFIIKSDWI